MTDGDGTGDARDGSHGPSGAPPSCAPIGTVRTPIETLEDAPRQGSESDIEGTVVVDGSVELGLVEMEAGRTIDVVWWADRADRGTLLVRDGTRGVFTTRSPDRPNPICVTPVTVLSVDGRRLRVRGVDMLDGSPVLDLKAHLS